MSKISTLLNYLNKLAPKRGHITISGFPSNEGNVIEMIRSIHERTSARVDVLVDDPRKWDIDQKFARTRLIKKNSIRGLLSYLTSQLVLFTHGLFGSIEPRPGKQIFVNLWHGDGIKQKPEFGSLVSSPFPADFTVGTSSVLAAQRAVELRYSPSTVIMTGAPRLRSMLGSSAGPYLQQFVFEKTGFRSYVLWMPTFRSAGAVGRTQARSDSSIAVDGFAPVTNHLRRTLHAQGIALVGKFHPLEKADMGGLVDLTIAEEMMEEWNTDLYEIIGGSSALVTDYSSIWVEYLILDRPIGFLTPDLQEYMRRRGLFPPDVMERLPGPNLESQEDVAIFVASIKSGGGHLLRAETRDWLGIPEFSESPGCALLMKLAELPELQQLLTPSRQEVQTYFGRVMSSRKVATG